LVVTWSPEEQTPQELPAGAASYVVPRVALKARRARREAIHAAPRALEAAPRALEAGGSVVEGPADQS
jgi:hypothetical protein